MRTDRRRILAVVVATQGVAVGVTVGSFTLFVEPIEAAFAAPRSQVSLGNSLIVVALALSGPFVGHLFDRGHGRDVLLGGGLLLAAALGLAASATSLWVLGAAAILAGVAIPALGPLAAVSLVTRSFAEDRGRALGLMSMGPPLGASAFAAIVGGVIPAWGWRGAYALLAVLTLVVVLPLVIGFVPARLEAPAAGPGETSAPLGTAEIARMPAFWLTALGFALTIGIVTGWTSQMDPFLGTLGLAKTARAGLVAGQFVLGIPGALLFGALADRVGPLRPFLLILVFQGCAFLGWAVGLPTSVAASLVLAYGLMGGGLVPLFSLLLSDRVGPAAVGRSIGMANVLLPPCAVGAITLASLTYDRAGSYAGALFVFAGVVVLSMASLLLSERAARRRARRLARGRLAEVHEG